MADCSASSLCFRNKEERKVLVTEDIDKVDTAGLDFTKVKVEDMSTQYFALPDIFKSSKYFRSKLVNENIPSDSTRILLGFENAIKGTEIAKMLTPEGTLEECFECLEKWLNDHRDSVFSSSFDSEGPFCKSVLTNLKPFLENYYFKASSTLKTTDFSDLKQWPILDFNESVCTDLFTIDLWKKIMDYVFVKPFSYYLRLFTSIVDSEVEIPKLKSLL